MQRFTLLLQRGLSIACPRAFTSNPFFLSRLDLKLRHGAAENATPNSLRIIDLPVMFAYIILLSRQRREFQLKTLVSTFFLLKASFRNRLRVAQVSDSSHEVSAKLFHQQGESFSCNPCLRISEFLTLKSEK